MKVDVLDYLTFSNASDYKPGGALRSVELEE
jgi:hypothetical protein